MAGGMSDYEERRELDMAYGAGSPATVYVALFSVTPSDSGGGTEGTGANLARKALTNNAANFPAAATDGGGITTKGLAAFSFAAASDALASRANMVAFGLFDAATGGNLLDLGPLGTPKPVLSGDTPAFAVGALVISRA